jgi:hypothetical protein
MEKLRGIPPNNNTWVGTDRAPQQRFFALFQQNHVKENSLKTGIINVQKSMLYQNWY